MFGGEKPVDVFEGVEAFSGGGLSHGEALIGECELAREAGGLLPDCFGVGLFGGEKPVDVFEGVEAFSGGGLSHGEPLICECELAREARGLLPDYFGVGLFGGGLSGGVLCFDQGLKARKAILLRTLVDLGCGTDDLLHFG